MKILMIGLGSIGQRHLRNLRRLYGDEVEVLAYRVRGLQRTFSDDMRVQEGVSLEEAYGVRSFADLDAALSERPECAFITNITSKHVESARRAVEAGCDIFLEKPISDSMVGVAELLHAVQEGKRIAYVGYQNRFHPCARDVKRMLEGECIGKIVSAESEYSERLSTMHTYEDYRQTYMARREMGGGPILTLQIHCLDYLQWLFGAPEAVYAVAGRSGGLETDAEECASSLYTFQRTDGRTFPVYAHTDYYQYPAAHRLKVVGERGRIELDFNRAQTRLIVDGAVIEESVYADFQRNDMFLEELQEFFRCVESREKPESDLGQGVVGLRMALAAKKSAHEERSVLMEEIR